MSEPPTDDCLFCKIVKGQIPSDTVYEDDHVVAFRDISPQAPAHVLVIPRRHIGSLDEASSADRDLLGRLVLAAKSVAADQGIAGAYRLVSNCGAAAGQSVLHLHFHVLGGRDMVWPPG